MDKPVQTTETTHREKVFAMYCALVASGFSFPQATQVGFAMELVDRFGAEYPDALRDAQKTDPVNG